MEYWLFVFAWVFGNCLLALIPVGLARLIARGVQRDIDNAAKIRWLLWSPLLLLWLLFLPNGAYLLTEWRHYLSIVVDNRAYVSLFRDQVYSPDATVKLVGLTVFFAVYSLLGLVSTVAAIWPLERLAARYFRTGALLAMVFVLTSMGVYMGLVDRLNSWELTPATFAGVFRAAAAVITHPMLLAVVLAFAAFLRGVYAMYDVFVVGLQIVKDGHIPKSLRTDQPPASLAAQRRA